MAEESTDGERTLRYPAPDETPDTEPNTQRLYDRPTPPDGGAPPASGPPARRRRQTWVFAVGVGLVLVIGLGALAAYRGTLQWPWGGSAPGEAAPAASACPSPTPSIQAAAKTQVRVYNASTRHGLALSVSRELAKRGFTVPETPRNDPSKSKPTTAAVIRHGPNGLIAARTVATQVKGTVALQQDDRAGDVVDLVLGQSFVLLDPVAGRKALVVAPSPTASCATSR